MNGIKKNYTPRRYCMKLDLNDYFVTEFTCVIIKASTNHTPGARH